MPTRLTIAGLAAALLALAGCNDNDAGPIVVSAIGPAPELVNPNLKPLDLPSEILIENVAQGLVRLNAAGEIEPALAQSWIVSDDGLRYTFRLAPATWEDGSRVTAIQVAQRLDAARSRASRNPLKPLLGAIDEIVPMTDDVFEISLKSPRTNFLQLFAQPELGILRNGRGTGPLRHEKRGDGLLLRQPVAPEEAEEAPDQIPIMLRGDSAALAIARFEAGRSDFVTGGTIADLPLARASSARAAALRFDPAEGMFGLAFLTLQGPWAAAEARQALSAAIDRSGLAASLQIAEWQPRVSVLPDTIDELPDPALPGWATLAPADRRSRAVETLAAIDAERPLRLRVRLPSQPGFRLAFAHLQRDWRAIGVDAVAVQSGEADLIFVDEVAPVNLSTWYLRRFTCEVSRICDASLDAVLANARTARTAAERASSLSAADRQLADLALFIPIGQPIRWSLVSPRLPGFRPNAFGHHTLRELIEP